MRTSLAVILAMAAPLAAENGGGKLRWEKDWERAQVMAADIKYPMLVYFTEPDNPLDKALDEGALSDDAVIDSASHFVKIRFKWDDSPVQAGLRASLRVTGTPSVLFLDSKGVLIDRLGATEPRAVATQMKQVAQSFKNLTALRALPEASGSPWDLIRQRITELGSDDFEMRRRATDELWHLQVALRTALDQAAKSDDAEVRARAAEALKDDPALARQGVDAQSLEAVVTWLQKGVDQFWIARHLQQHNMTFSLTEEDVKRLRDAGASDDLLKAMRGTPRKDR